MAYNKGMENIEIQEKNEEIVRLSKVTKIYSSFSDQLKKKLNPNGKYKEVVAVDNVDLVVEKGEIFGLLGANGSGKTTIIKMICGLIQPTEGEVFVFNKNVKMESYSIHKELGAIVEAPTLMKDLTGLENLEYFAKLQGGIDKRRILDILELVGLKERQNSKFSTYSLGMQQRLGIAQAIMHNPKLLVLDEPINGLDPDGIIQIRDLLTTINKEYGTTIVISSHILTEMQALCSKVAIMSKGKIVAIKSSQEVQEEGGDVTIACILCDDAIKGQNVINDFDQEIETRVLDNKLYVRFKGDKLSQINKQLIINDINILQVTVKKRTLEELYKELTKNE